MTTLSKEHRVAMSMPEDATGRADCLIIEDRRSSRRLKTKLTAHVSGLGRSMPIACPTEDISEGGLFLCLPGDSGVCVGQRCEVVLAREPGSPAHPACVDEPVYATVVRTLPISEGVPSGIGAGLRFDNPIYL